MPEHATGELKASYDILQKKMGKVLNIFLHMGQSPAVLKGFMAIQESAGKLSIPQKIQEQIALATAQNNKCGYCLSVHTQIAKTQGLSEEEILSARKSEAHNAKEAAILRFVNNIVEKRGKVSDMDVEAVKKAGVSDKEIVEIIFLVNMNMFTNYFNHIVNTEIDFPKVQV